MCPNKFVCKKSLCVQISKLLVIHSSFDLNLLVLCPEMGECVQYFGAGGSGPAGSSQFSLLGQRGNQSLLPESDGKVPETAGCAGGPHSCLCSLGQTQARMQHKFPYINLHTV